MKIFITIITSWKAIVLSLVLCFLIDINYSQANLIKDLYNKYTNKIGYKDLIIGASADIIDKYCKKTPSTLIQWKDLGIADYVCYNDLDWGYIFDIKEDKISLIAMSSIFYGEPDKKNKNATKYNELTIKPLVNSLDKRYIMDGSPLVENNYSRKATTWTFGKESVFLLLSETGSGNLVSIFYREKYASGSF
jgi:hypothetical protein